MDKMNNYVFPVDFKGANIFFVGIKGTGMAALAELLQKKGALISGSDVEEKFYTDDILKGLGIPFYESFDPVLLPDKVSLVVHSSAYSPLENPQLKRAVSNNIPVMEYSRALGELSLFPFSCGISGVHGKTTTTSIAGTILKNMDLPVSVLAGSGVSNFGGSSVLVQGDKFFLAETCEYKRHFLAFHPDVLVITNVEEDHLDYFKDMDDIMDAFISYGKKLSKRGTLIYCKDNAGARKAAVKIKKARGDITLVEYGWSAKGPFRITSLEVSGGKSIFKLEGFDPFFTVRIPGEHTVLDSTAALAVATVFLKETEKDLTEKVVLKLKIALDSFTGSKRRSEIIGEWNNILIMDDYGHHPTEIETTLKGLREFYPDRRIVVDFMSHTYSRTQALLDKFASSFYSADIVILHKIYSSAREKIGSVTGKTLFKEVKKNRDNVYYFEEVLDALTFCREILQPGDLFITLGAGNNWILGDALKKFFMEGVRK